MTGDEALQKSAVEIPLKVQCPTCGWSGVTIKFSRKKERVRVECEDCGIVEDEVVPFGGGAILGEL